MDYYDIALQSCGASPAMEAELGFRHIFLAGKEVPLLNSGKKGNFSGAIFSGTNKKLLVDASRGGARALILEDMRIDRSLIDTMVKKGTALCIPMYAVTSKEGMERSKALFLLKGLFEYVRHRGMHVGFVSLAPSRSGLCSSMQLVEFAKLIGADEQYARYSIGAVNRAIANGDED